MRWYFPILVFLLSGATPIFSQEGGDGGNQVSDNYIIRASDVIQFKVFNEPGLDTQVRISADGKMSLPWIGEIYVAGMSLRKAREHVYQRYNSDYLVNPQIQLDVVYFSENRVQVLGQVGKQGDIIIPPEESLTLLQAISKASGWTRLSNKKKVKLKRITSNGELTEHTIDARNISIKDWPLQKGDVILVPEIIL